MSQFSPYLLIFVAIMLCYIYVISSAFFHHRKCNYIHETTVSILLGIILGVFLITLTTFFSTANYQQYLRGIIVLILLPPMLFEDGYNIKKRKFFQNIAYINLFGIFGTIVTFFLIYGIFYAFNYYGLIKTVNQTPIVLQNWQILALSSLLCSIDTVVPQKIVNPQRYPKLFSIIFGESILKDTITVTLFDSIVNIYQTFSSTTDRTQFDATDFISLVINFLEVIGGSILIGVVSAVITTFIFKKMRFLLDEKGVSQVPIIILTGYAAYILSEWAAFSGVIAMLFCGITLSHFNIYNLTTEGKTSTKITVSALAKVAEGLLFFLLGAFIFGIQITEQSDQTVSYTFSWILLLICLGSIIISRVINIYVMSLIGYFIIGKDKWRLNHYEYQILTASGLIKGAIPFALALSIPKGGNKFTTVCIQNSVILLVFITSFFLNSLLPKLLRNRLHKIDQMLKTHQNHPSLYDSLLIQIQQKEAQIKKHEKSVWVQSNRTQSRKSELESIVQQKKKLESIALYTKAKSTTQKYWRKFEEGVVKPFLIYDYYSRKEQIKLQKIRIRKEEMEEFWRRFSGENMLDPENEQENKFIDVKLIENESDEDKQEQQSQKGEDKGGLVYHIKKKKSNSVLQQEITEIKVDKSKTDLVNCKKNKANPTPLYITQTGVQKSPLYAQLIQKNPSINQQVQRQQQSPSLDSLPRSQQQQQQQLK